MDWAFCAVSFKVVELLSSVWTILSIFFIEFLKAVSIDFSIAGVLSTRLKALVNLILPILFLLFMGIWSCEYVTTGLRYFPVWERVCYPPPMCSKSDQIKSARASLFSFSDSLMLLKSSKSWQIRRQTDRGCLLSLLTQSRFPERRLYRGTGQSELSLLRTML